MDQQLPQPTSGTPPPPPHPLDSQPPPPHHDAELRYLLSSKQKLGVVSQKAEMKRKLATVTPEIYNGLDLIVDSPEFNQVGSIFGDMTV